MKYRHHFLFVTAIAWLILICAGCATPYLKGITPRGEKIYVGPVPLQGTGAYQAFLRSPRTEADKINFLFKRFTTAKDLIYHRDGETYNWLEAYRGAKWLLRNRYKGNENARQFIRDHVWYSEETGKPHAIEFPDGSIHTAYYVLINELDLLEETLAKDPNAKKKAVVTDARRRVSDRQGHANA